MALTINKCVCSNITFSEVKEIALRNNADSLAKLQQKVDVAVNCRLCVPYIQEMLKTGETEFHKIIIKEE